MKAYILTRGQIVEYADVLGVDPERWKDGPEEEKWVMMTERELPPGIVDDNDIGEVYLIDNETGIQFKPTFLGIDELDKHEG